MRARDRGIMLSSKLLQKATSPSSACCTPFVYNLGGGSSIETNYSSLLLSAITPGSHSSFRLLKHPTLSKMPGFDFSNHNRNAALHAQGVPLPKATSTGTTIVGCIFDGGVVIAADTRATSGPIVADKVCQHLGSNRVHCTKKFSRIARNSITSLLRYGVPAPAQQQTRNSPPP